MCISSWEYLCSPFSSPSYMQIFSSNTVQFELYDKQLKLSGSNIDQSYLCNFMSLQSITFSNVNSEMFITLKQARAYLGVSVREL